MTFVRCKKEIHKSGFPAYFPRNYVDGTAKYVGLYSFKDKFKFYFVYHDTVNDNYKIVFTSADSMTRGLMYSSYSKSLVMINDGGQVPYIVATSVDDSLTFNDLPADTPKQGVSGRYIFTQSGEQEISDKNQIQIIATNMGTTKQYM